MAYLDLGKWLVTLESGSRFGYDLVLLMLCFNLSAILCQYLSSCIGMVTGKNLAQICRQEYSQTLCVVLGLQAGLSLLTSEVSRLGMLLSWDFYVLMIAGTAIGFKLVFEYNDLMTVIWFTSVVVNLLPYTLSLLDKRMAGMFNTYLAGFTLVYFVLGLLVSHPNTPVNMNVMFPKLSGESAYSLMALLGINIIVHSFYTHSSVVQIFTNPVAPIVLLVILVFSGHIISMTCIIGSDVISENLFGVKLPLFAHHILPKVLAMMTIMYHAKVAGSDGLYPLLIMCPVIQAMFLPAAVIPIFRVSSSRLLMGRYKMSLYVEILAFLAFLLTLFTNIIFTAEILFGDSTWTNDLKGNTGSPILLPYAAVVLISCASIAFTLFLAVNPLKSACIEAQELLSSVHPQRKTLDDAHHNQVASLEHSKTASEHIGHSRSAFEHNGSSDTTVQSTDHMVINPEARPSLSINREETKTAVVNWTQPVSKVCSATIVEHNTPENFNVNSLTEKDA
ncbi:ethylene-insensitive protein 2-like [Panicum miliaceum]|uniref:Ethylene-insensitive protein 2-like n=1 Tax=Panicum miliaceum TaxID=4540 RepID=A0A3L6SGF3_PANMI|nr:ethylene-insensitive protein 2-like [Panicum miliaceum]